MIPLVICAGVVFLALVVRFCRPLFWLLVSMVSGLVVSGLVVLALLIFGHR